MADRRRFLVDAARLGGLPDELAFAVGELAVGPCHLNERREIEQLDGVVRVTELPQFVQKSLVDDTGVFRETPEPRGLFGALAYLGNQLLLELLEMAFFALPPAG